MPFDGPNGYALACDTWATSWAPRRALGITAWADTYRLLSAKAAAEPGEWRTSRVPYLAGVMAALDETHPAPLVVFKKSSQVGGSEVGLNWIGRTIHQRPQSFLCLFPSEKGARKWVRTRLNPMLASTPELRALIPPGRKSDAGNTLQEKHYQDGVLFTGSANIPEDLAGVSVPYLLLDEVDRMAHVIEGEGNPIELAKARVTTFPRHKIFEISSPTDEGSQIDVDWQISTKDRYYVPCPHCTHMQFLRWEMLKWTPGKPQQAAYCCEDCGVLIGEHFKTQMLAAGEWRSEHPEREHEVKGFHINGLYSPLGLGRRWADHAATWERVKGDPSKVQVFYNTRLGEIFKSKKEALAWEEVKARAESYRVRTIPQGVLVLTAGADVQQDRIEVQLLGWDQFERATVIDYAIIYGDTTREDVFDKLDAYLLQPIRNTFGVDIPIKSCAIDASFRQHEVVNFCRDRARKARNVFAIKGADRAGRLIIGKPTLVNVAWNGKIEKRGGELYIVGVSLLKHMIYGRLAADAGTHDAPVPPSERHYRFSSDLLDEYFRGLTAERFDPREGWVKVYERNEPLDTFVQAHAAALHHSTQIDRLRAADWERLSVLYETPAVASSNETNGPRLRNRLMPSAAEVQNGGD